MVGATIAKCESCGAALRLGPAVRSVTCEYCGVTATLAAQGTAVEGPLVRVAPAPEVRNQYAGGLVVGAIFGVIALGCLIGLLTGGPLGFAFGIAVFGAGAGLGFYAYVLGKREASELGWFREHGQPGRARIESIAAATSGHTATLSLVLERTDGPARRLEHRTTIPPLIVPRLSDGMALPILAHPNFDDRIEIQWHLV